MRTASKRPGSFAMFTPSPGLLVAEAFFLGQAAIGTGTEPMAWATLALAAPLLGFMLRWGDRVERARRDA